MDVKILKEINSFTYPTKEYAQVVESLQDGEDLPLNLKKKYGHFTLKKDSALVYGTKKLVPTENIEKVIQYHYSKTFFGMGKLYQYIRDRYLGISQNKVYDFVKNNKISQVHRLPQNVPSLKNTKPRKIPKEAMKHLQVDLTFIRDKVIFVLIDILSKYVWVKILNNKEGSTVSRAMMTYLGSHPKPTIVQTDLGSEFRDDFDLVLKTFGVKHVRSRPFTPTSQGIVERMNGPIKNSVERFVTSRGGNPSGWQKFLLDWIDLYNDSEHSATGFTPNELKKGKEEYIKIALENIKKQAEPLAKERRELASKIDFPVEGDSVRIKLAKTSVLSKASAPQFSSVVYPITRDKIMKNKDGIWSYKIRGRIYQADQLLKVDPEELIDQTPERDYVQPLPKTALEQRSSIRTRSDAISRSGREIKAPKRLGF
eukprot:Lithocolla_globosa_v1_NODE_403_length_4161_cov_23.135899.p1 type:complete len:426 gc:universal NODE_403_length_4161_cov_23.135899:3180-1903(-)